MDSAALTTYLETEWAEVIAETGITAGYIVGIVEEVYAADTDLAATYAEPLGDYYLLRRAVRWAATQFDLSTEGDSLSLGKRVDRWKAWLDELAGQIGWIVGTEGGGIVTVTSDWSLGAIGETGA